MKTIHKLLTCIIALTALFALSSCHSKEEDRSSYNGTRWFCPYTTHMPGNPDLVYLDHYGNPNPCPGYLLEVTEQGKGFLYELDADNKIVRTIFRADYYFTQLGGKELKLINESGDYLNISDRMEVFDLERKNTLIRHGVPEIYYYINSEGREMIDNDAASVYTRTFRPLSDFIK